MQEPFWQLVKPLLAESEKGYEAYLAVAAKAVSQYMQSIG